MIEALSNIFAIAPVCLAVLFLILRSLTRNPWIKKRLGLSIFLCSVAFFLWIISQTVNLRFDFSDIQGLILLLAVIFALVVVLFNRFSGSTVSDRFPSIVQDAIVIGIFALVATYYAPDKLFATSAVGALVVGLALQDTLGNLFAGLALQVEKPFFVGDWVRLGSLEGKVKEVTWRATKIRTKKGEFCVIPNTIISKDTLVNYTHPSPVLRCDHLVGISYESPPNRVKGVILETMRDIPDILSDPAPDVLLEKYNDFSIDYRCRFWIDDFGNSEPIMDKFTTMLYYKLQRAGLRIPFPIRDLRMWEPSSQKPDEEERLLVRRKFIESIDLFENLNEEERQEIARSLERITFAAGEPIVRQGDKGDSMFFIEQGRVRIVLESGGVMSQLAVLDKGQFLGEMSLLTGERRTATAIAMKDVHAYVLRKDRFGGVLELYPNVVEEICRIMALRKDALDAKNSELISSKEQQERAQQSFLRRVQDFFGL